MRNIIVVLSMGLFAFLALESRACPSTNEDFSKENLVKEMKAVGIRHIDIAVAQAMLESANFTSRLFRLNNNMFGMQLATKRETTALGKKRGYAYYSCWRCSVHDYGLRQKAIFKRHPKMNRTQYLAHIRRWYAEDPNYMAKLYKRIKIVRRSMENLS